MILNQLHLTTVEFKLKKIIGECFNSKSKFSL